MGKIFPQNWNSDCSKSLFNHQVREGLAKGHKGNQSGCSDLPKVGMACLQVCSRTSIILFLTTNFSKVSLRVAKDRCWVFLNYIFWINRPKR
jgi:hypothetical protein